MNQQRSVIVQILSTLMSGRGHSHSLALFRRIQVLDFGREYSVSGLIKKQVGAKPDRSRHKRKQVEPSDYSPQNRKPIAIKDLYGRLSLPSTQQSAKNAYRSCERPEVFSISEFVIDSPNQQGESRLVALDWLIRVVKQLKLSRDVFYNTVHYLDVYRKAVSDPKYQKLVCMAILSLVAKLQHQSSVNVADCISKLDSTVSRQTFIDQQLRVFRQLSFSLVPITLYSRLLYHLSQLSSLNRHFKHYKVVVIDLLLPKYFKQYLKLCEKLDAVLISNIHKDYCLDSVIYSLLQDAFSRLYSHRQFYLFSKVHQQYWKGKHVVTQVQRLNRLNKMLDQVEVHPETDWEPEGRNHQEKLRVQTYSPHSNTLAQKIIQCSSSLLGGSLH